MAKHTITRRAALPAVAIAAASLVQSPVYAQFEKTKTQNSFPVFSPDLKSLKESMKPFTTKWWTVNFGNYTYYFCREEPPFFGVSRFDIHGWYQCTGDDDERLFHIWSFRSHGVGDIQLKIDETLGTLSVMGLERKVKGKQLGFFSLAAVTP